MRADRLVATLLLMQARGRVTAAELAAELEVSVATARRDLESLSAAGIPVYPQPGRGGGWSLVGGARTDLSGLSATEAQALFLLVGPAAAVSAEAKAALRKLVRALPSTFRADAEAAASATMIDPTRWGERDRHRPAMVDLLQSAVVRRRKVRLSYTSGARERTERLVEPWGLVDKDDIWYLLAGTAKGQRTFRVERIIEATVTEEPAERPDDFTLAAAWDKVVGEVEQKRSRTWATVVIESRFVPVLRNQFGRHCEVDEERDGRAWVRLAAPTPLDLARNLAGWGTMVEVLEPVAVQAELARIGTELAGRYTGETYLVGAGAVLPKGIGALGTFRKISEQA
ncbi:MULTISPECIES: YafY family protein [unclassified Crossiella]|uniref:helix-turn-helix transcriptional regulator n=1 Tax=unclassified Crossiella TaxID=2620835 RepID=UPI001FFFE51D|nr:MULTISPECIES: WYL domain-containing protein [unclassified Crossiella]MCK2239139.1 WYL domain-containing protein [Crossiella sp. S99.2]MCK2251292.1 WYL domain-containing protein [Crossiella sp. S99.1]